MFWETLPGLIAVWSAAVAGLIYLTRQIWKATKFGKKVAVALGRLIELGTTDHWPNGAKTLPEAMNEIYKRQGETKELLESYIVAHRADHGLLPAPRSDLGEITGTPV